MAILPSPHDVPRIHETPIQASGGTVLKVLGLGGGGTNAVNRMMDAGINGVEFIAANTDHQALQDSMAPVRIHLGPRLTRGLGAGGDASQGEKAALESQAEIGEALRGADMVFVTAGMGGGTGTGAILVAAEIARSMGAVTIAVVTTPFTFEGSKRDRTSREGIARLSGHVDTLITVPNDKLLEIAPRTASLEVAFHMADEVLRQGVQGIAELITRPGLINVDFANIRRLMQLGGGALLAIGQGRGSNKAVEAVQSALNNKLIDLSAIDHAAGILAHFTGGDDLSLHEVNQAVTLIQEMAAPDAEIVFGVTTDAALAGKAQLILVATGVGCTPLEEVMPSVRQLVSSRSGSREAPPQPPWTGRQGRLTGRLNRLVDSSASLAGRLPTSETTLRAGQRSPAWVTSGDSGLDPDDLELPAFLRRERQGKRGSHAAESEAS